jgi:hypothetical protein
MGDKVSNFEPPFQLFLSKTSKKKGNRTHGARPAPWNRSAAASQQASTGYGDARAHDDPLKQQSKRPNHQNLPKKQLPRVSLSPPSSIVSPPGCALLLVVTSPLSVSLHLPPHLAASGDLAAFPFRVPGRSLPRGGGAGERADVAVPAAVLPAAARRAGRDLRQHPRCVHFPDPPPGDPAILTWFLCAYSTVDQFVRGVS